MAIWDNRVCLVLIIVLLKVTCHEKTLRKIVRDQSKMVQRPFSDRNGGEIIWRKSPLALRLGINDAQIHRGFAQVKTVIHKLQRPKISTIMSSVDTSRVKSLYSKKVLGRNSTMNHEQRMARNTLGNITALPHNKPHSKRLRFSDNEQGHISNISRSRNIAVESYYEIPTHSRFFPSMDDQSLQNGGEQSKENVIMIPENHDAMKLNTSLHIKSMFSANKNKKTSNSVPAPEHVTYDTDIGKADFLIQEQPIPIASSLYTYNVSVTPYTCTEIQESTADIVTQEKFSGFEIEPVWISKKHYWNYIFESRYESLMRSEKWPALKVILVPRTHVDSIWKRTFEQYHNATVEKILSNVVKKLQFYRNLTFSWNEVSHLSQWWQTTTAKSRSLFRRLLRGGRLEITTGGWVEPDEGTTDLFGLIHQLIEGHQWLKNNLNYVPKVAWLTSSVTHSPTMTYLLSTAGMTNLVLTNLHYSWEEYLAEFQYSDFIWLQDWDSVRPTPSVLNTALNRIGNSRYPKHSVLTHFLQFNSDGFSACGPNASVCISNFIFTKSNENLDVQSYNLKEKSELLLEQYSKSGTLSPHNVVIAPIGGAYRYELQSEFDYQYNNYLKIADFINTNRNVYKATIEFGTPKDYFKSIFERHKSYTTLKGDFLNFADLMSGSPAYWTGFFTSRPLFKILLRRLQSSLRSAEILFSFAVASNAFQYFNAADLFALLVKARQVVGRLLDRNVVSGTLTANSLKYARSQMLRTVKNCWYIQEVAASLMSIKPEQNTPYLQKYVYRDGEIISSFRTVAPGDQIYVFNSLSHERTDIVEITVRNPKVRIVDHNKREVTIQVSPVWKYSTNNLITISRQFFKITFAIIVPPLTLELYKVKPTYDTAHSATIYCSACIIDEATQNTSFSFNIQPLDPGDIQLESYKHRLIFDEFTGFLKTVVEKATNFEKTVLLDYGAFRSANSNSGTFLFNTNVTKPIHDLLMPYRIGTKSKQLIIVTGQITTELNSIYGRLLQSTVKIFNLRDSPLSNTIYVESKVDYEVSPKHRELEMFLSIQTDIGNGNPPEIYTDNNGFQYTKRILKLSRRVESNLYPITSMVYLQDRKSRFTFITDHAQGVTALQEGQLVIMLDRRVLFDDGRGTNEGLADSSATCHRNYILLENFIETRNSSFASPNKKQLPSLTAVYLANSLNNLLDVFIIEKKQTDLCYYASLPLIKNSFPCDVALITYRANFVKGASSFTSSTALMILHKQTASCNTDDVVNFYCNGETIFNVREILHGVKAVYQTNLVGTSKGVPITVLNKGNFPPMELTTLRIHL